MLMTHDALVRNIQNSRTLGVERAENSRKTVDSIKFDVTNETSASRTNQLLSEHQTDLLTISFTEVSIGRQYF
jgi:hypothetical protein